MGKKMLFMWVKSSVHNGHRGRVQRYKCKACGYRFSGGVRRDKQRVIADYVEGKQTHLQLSAKYKVSPRTIARDLEHMRHVRKVSTNKKVVIQMDTTYWGRSLGLMAIKDAFNKRIIWHKYVRHETIADYMEGVVWLREHGFTIYGAVCDGIKGLMQALWPYPVQMCQYHQMMIVRRYLTAEPELEASRALLSLVNGMTGMDKESFTESFRLWHQTYKDMLDERVPTDATKPRRTCGPVSAAPI